MQEQASLPAMTTTDDDPYYAAPVGQLGFVFSSLKDGGGQIDVTWTSSSPWVPKGQLQLSTHDESVVHLTTGQIAEGLIKQLRPVLAAMVSTVWSPF